MILFIISYICFSEIYNIIFLKSNKMGIFKIIEKLIKILIFFERGILVIKLR